MTIHTIIATVTICSIVTLTGCATKQAAKTDITASSTMSSSAAPTSAPDKKTDGIGTDSVMADKITSPGAGAEPIAGSETRLDPIYFDFNSYLLRSDARDTLSRNASRLEGNRQARIVIEGHADERGSDEYNLALAEKRAFAAQSYIKTLGIKSDRMETISYGEDKPAVIGEDEESWAKNRRVEFIIVK